METDLNPSPLNKNTIDSTQEHVEETVTSVDKPPPMRTSKKRLLPLSPGRERKRKCLQDENANAYRPKRIPTYDDDDDKKALPVNKGQKENTLKGIISRPKPLRASRSINKAIIPGAHNKTKSFDTDFGAGRTAPVGLSLRGASAITSKSKSLNNSIPGTDSQPLFASDVYRQLALEKAQRESKVQFAKPVSIVWSLFLVAVSNSSFCRSHLLDPRCDPPYLLLSFFALRNELPQDTQKVMKSPRRKP